jgi:transposase InsO family protein
VNGQTPHIHHSDQGVQYAAATYIATLKQAGVAMALCARFANSMAEVGQAWQNDYAERSASCALSKRRELTCLIT